MPNNFTKPNEITTTGSGNGSELSHYKTVFGLVTKDGSGNPPDDLSSGQTRLFYNKDLDLVQNMRNLFSLVSGFKETLDNIVTASGYGGWTIMTSYVYPQDRIPGLMYLNATLQYNDTNEMCVDVDGNPIPIWKIRAEVIDRYGSDVAKLGILKFASDADIVYYDPKDSYGLNDLTVKEAIDALSHRSIILKATLLANDAWTLVRADDTVNNQTGEDYYYQEVAVDGMMSTDYPIVTLNPNHTMGGTLQNTMASAADCNQLLEIGHVSRIQTLTNKIRAFCYDGHRPTTDLPLIFRVLRGHAPGEI